MEPIRRNPVVALIRFHPTIFGVNLNREIHVLGNRARDNPDIGLHACTVASIFDESSRIAAGIERCILLPGLDVGEHDHEFVCIGRDRHRPPDLGIFPSTGYDGCCTSRCWNRSVPLTFRQIEQELRSYLTGIRRIHQRPECCAFAVNKIGAIYDLNRLDRCDG